MSDPKNYYHSATGHEAKDVIRAWGLNFALGNAVKYIARAGLKSQESAVKDLIKAIDYLRDEIDARQADDLEVNDKVKESLKGELG